jgi:hypothetical protein
MVIIFGDPLSQIRASEMIYSGGFKIETTGRDMKSDISKTGFFHISLDKDISQKASSPHIWLFGMIFPARKMYFNLNVLICCRYFLLMFVPNDMRCWHGLLLEGGNCLFSPQLGQKADDGIDNNDNQDSETFNSLI